MTTVRPDGEEAVLQAVIDQMMVQRNSANDVRQQARNVIKAYLAAVDGETEAPSAPESDGAKLARFVEALTPSGDTKGDYHGRFKMEYYDYDIEAEERKLVHIHVGWDTIKDVMKAVLARATRR